MRRSLRWLFGRCLPIGLASQLVFGCFDYSPLTIEADEIETVYVGSGGHMFQALDAQTGQKKWEVSLNEDILTLPATSNGLVFIADPHHFYAISAKNGARQWEFNTGVRPSSIYRPVTDGQTVFLLGNNNNTIYALDAQTGAKRWSNQSAVFLRQGGWFSGPAIADGTIYVGGTDSTLHALDAQTGATRWRFRAKSTFQSRPLVVGSVVYAGCYDGKLYVLDAQTGQKKWETVIGGYVQSPRIVGDLLYVTNWSELFAVDAQTGNRRWQYQPHIYQNYTGSASLLSINNGVVYGGFVPLDWNDGFMYTVDAATGTPKRDLWPWPGGHNDWITCAQVDKGVLYTTSRDNTVRAMDPQTGTVKWSYRADSYLTYSLGLVSKQGKLIEP